MGNTSKHAGLTPRQKAFAEAYAGNATEAAIKAGYSVKTAYSHGQRLLKNVEIEKVIALREEREASNRIASRQERQEFWTITIRDAGADMKDRLKASELLGKSEGDFLDRVNISGGIDLGLLEAARVRASHDR